MLLLLYFRTIFPVINIIDWPVYLLSVAPWLLSTVTMMIGVIKWEYQYLFPKTFNATLFRSLEDPEKSFSI